MGKDIQGQNLANPTSMILSGVLLLRHLGLEDHAQRIGNAVFKVVHDGKCKTQDVDHGTSTTTDFTLAVIANL